MCVYASLSNRATVLINTVLVTAFSEPAEAHCVGESPIGGLCNILKGMAWYFFFSIKKDMIQNLVVVATAVKKTIGTGFFGQLI